MSKKYSDINDLIKKHIIEDIENKAYKAEYMAIKNMGYRKERVISKSGHIKTIWTNRPLENSDLYERKYSTRHIPNTPFADKLKDITIE